MRYVNAYIPLSLLYVNELCTTLTVTEVSDLLLVGSSEGSVLLLVNSVFLCPLSLDLEFSRLSVMGCVVVEPSLQEIRDELLPVRVGRVVDIAFCSPLYIQLCHEGTVCIQHVASTVYLQMVPLCVCCECKLAEVVSVVVPDWCEYM